jgi:hypothetical protein
MEHRRLKTKHAVFHGSRLSLRSAGMTGEVDEVNFPPFDYI